MITKDRLDIINDMCYTMRHDYGLVKTEGAADWESGMTPSEQRYLFMQMAQLFDNCIVPYMRFKNDET